MNTLLTSTLFSESETKPGASCIRSSMLDTRPKFSECNPCTVKPPGTSLLICSACAMDGEVRDSLLVTTVTKTGGKTMGAAKPRTIRKQPHKEAVMVCLSRAIERARH